MSAVLDLFWSESLYAYVDKREKCSPQNSSNFWRVAPQRKKEIGKRKRTDWLTDWLVVKCQGWKFREGKEKTWLLWGQASQLARFFFFEFRSKGGRKGSFVIWRTRRKNQPIKSNASLPERKRRRCLEILNTKKGIYYTLDRGTICQTDPGHS